MVEKIVTKYILALIKAQVITEKEKETYKYHIICAVESILVMLTMTGVGFYFHEVIHVWAFIACFFMIRNRTGGFHFDSFWKCYLGTVGLEIFVIYLVDFTSNNVIVIDMAKNRCEEIQIRTLDKNNYGEHRKFFGQKVLVKNEVNNIKYERK